MRQKREDLVCREYLEAVVQALRHCLGPRLLSVVLYGSVARGTATVTSDLDLLIVVREAPTSYYERLWPVLDAVRSLHRPPGAWSPPVSPLILSEEEAKENRYIFPRPGGGRNPPL